MDYNQLKNFLFKLFLHKVQAVFYSNSLCYHGLFSVALWDLLKMFHPFVIAVAQEVE